LGEVGAHRLFTHPQFQFKIKKFAFVSKIIFISPCAHRMGVQEAEPGAKRSGATGFAVEYHKQAGATCAAVASYSPNPVAPLRFAPGSAFQCFLIDYNSKPNHNSRAF
jgi:hypothetical protein